MDAAGQEPVALRTRAADLERLVIVASRDHAGPKVEALLARLPTASTCVNLLKVSSPHMALLARVGGGS